jgi:hypothetical protein
MKPIARVVSTLATAVVAMTMVAPAVQARTTWDTTPVTVVKQVKPLPHVVDMRVGGHQRFDRVVIDLDGHLPGYRVRYVKELAYDGSGEAVPIKGRRFISVSLTPARAHDASGASTYNGPNIGSYGLDAIRQVAFTGDFEGHVSFGISLRHKVSFRVFTLHRPNRLVIDVRH